MSADRLTQTEFAVDRPRSVIFEETGEERFVTGYCKVCGTDPDDFPFHTIISPSGVCHTQGDDGMETMRCGANGAAEGWWWRL